MSAVKFTFDFLSGPNKRYGDYAIEDIYNADETGLLETAGMVYLMGDILLKETITTNHLDLSLIHISEPTRLLRRAGGGGGGE
mgnify:CR=1 FL=1